MFVNHSGCVDVGVNIGEYSNVSAISPGVMGTTGIETYDVIEAVRNKIDVLETNLSNMNRIPYSVRAIIDNPTLRGIHNILGNVVDTKEEYVSMLEVALGASMNNIIVEDTMEFLKRLGLLDYRKEKTEDGKTPFRFLWVKNQLPKLEE